MATLQQGVQPLDLLLRLVLGGLVVVYVLIVFRRRDLTAPAGRVGPSR